LNRTPSSEDIVLKVQELAATVRREDLLALENVVIEEPFMAKGIRMAVDGVSVETIKETLSRELASLGERHRSGQRVFKRMSATAPSMGMIGTLIGLVQMLSRLDDPSSIGPAMAVALLTTLYGAVLAFMIFGPIADKLGSRTADETRNMRIFLECLDSIINGENQMIIKEKLDAFLAPKKREQAWAA
ncbi:MAG: MotA/TolQ/ExbB proton channel family protein, partial [Myxococcota bacterium]